MPLENLRPSPQPDSGSAPANRPARVVFLSFALLLFLANALAAFASQSYLVAFDSPMLTRFATLVVLPTLLVSLMIYGMMAFNPAVPKRWFLPLIAFGPAAGLLSLPLYIYFYHCSAWIGWGISLAQVVLCLTILRQVLGSWKVRWPLMAPQHFGASSFRWSHLIGFTAVHLFLVLPAAVIYLLGCASLAANHFTDGFVTLRPSGISMEIREYVRTDGKIVELVPMSHIADLEFYQTLSASLPATATFLLEGVSDRTHRLPDKVGYGKTAASLGLVEQQLHFKPKGKLVAADLDLSEFSESSLELLRRTMAVHSQGMATRSLPLFATSPSPTDLQSLFDDLLVQRNRHLLMVLEKELLESDHLVVPWGAAHMPGIADGVLQAGFRLHRSQQHVAIRFGGRPLQ
jgi:hypothetical protein